MVSMAVNQCVRSRSGIRAYLDVRVHGPSPRTCEFQITLEPRGRLLQECLSRACRIGPSVNGDCEALRAQVDVLVLGGQEKPRS